MENKMKTLGKLAFGTGLLAVVASALFSIAKCSDSLSQKHAKEDLQKKKKELCEIIHLAELYENGKTNSEGIAEGENGSVSGVYHSKDGSAKVLYKGSILPYGYISKGIIFSFGTGSNALESIQKASCLEYDSVHYDGALKLETHPVDNFAGRSLR